ncbi:MAG: enoyl-CoA hydratase-related protein [Sphingobium sp.]
MTDLVLFEVVDGVGVITLNRPERLNALDDAMHHALDAVFVRAFQSNEARVIVLTGAGRGFCAGADISRLERLSAQGGAGFDIPRPGTVGEAFVGIDAPADYLNTYTFPLALKKPVIAAINGPCVGAGLVLAASCDIRFASRSAMFAAAFAQRGVVAEFGLAWMLPRLVGANAAADLLFSGRRLESDEAARLGLVGRVEEDDALLDTVMAYARHIASTASPRSIAIIKQQLLAASGQTFGEASAEAYDLLIESLSSEDFVEATLSYKERRSAQFTGR